MQKLQKYIFVIDYNGGPYSAGDSKEIEITASDKKEAYKKLKEHPTCEELSDIIESIDLVDIEELPDQN